MLDHLGKIIIALAIGFIISIMLMFFPLSLPVILGICCGIHKAFEGGKPRGRRHGVYMRPGVGWFRFR